ncbi:MAG: CcmD family protein [Cytophagaceae bacterium]|nr:CcmD family protein [Cytophagaceae bacterium]
MKKLFSFLVFLLISANLMAQQTVGTDVEMADTMRSNGKIYVVVAVFAVVMAGLILYLITLDRKIGRLEKELRK